jgi:hypothetical protein
MNKNFGLLVSKFFLVQILLFTAKKIRKARPKVFIHGQKWEKDLGGGGGSIGGKRNLE